MTLYLKEYWVNAYTDGLTQWLGWVYPEAYYPSIPKESKTKLIYRIHVRLK